MMTVTCDGCAAADNCPDVLLHEKINKRGHLFGQVRNPVL